MHHHYYSAFLFCAVTANKVHLSELCFASINAEGVTMIENKRPDWLLQYYKHCQKLIKVGSYHNAVHISYVITLTISQNIVCFVIDYIA